MFSIRLCISYDGADACGDKEATPAQRRTIEQILWQMPQITGLRYENKQEALDDFLEASPNLIGVMKESDMPETFTGRLHRWSDAPAFNSALKKLPGIAVIHVIPTPLWEGTADMTIILCDNSRRWGPCERRGRATADERAAVGVLLRRMKGVKRIYFANQAHNMWMFKQFDTLLSHVINPAPQRKDDGANPLDEYYDSYYVKLDDPMLVPSVSDKVEGLPGVFGGVRVSVWYGLVGF